MAFGSVEVRPQSCHSSKVAIRLVHDFPHMALALQNVSDLGPISRAPLQVSTRIGLDVLEQNARAYQRFAATVRSRSRAATQPLPSIE